MFNHIIFALPNGQCYKYLTQRNYIRMYNHLFIKMKNITEVFTISSVDFIFIHGTIYPNLFKITAVGLRAAVPRMQISQQLDLRTCINEKVSCTGRST